MRFPCLYVISANVSSAASLNLVGRDGVRGKVNVNLTDEEVAKLRYSADTLKQVINNLEI